jgi:tetratricopeptide (TPR) repeat protein
MLLCGPVMASQASPKLQCDSPKIGKAVLSGDLDAALAQIQHCIESSRADLEAAEKEYAGKPGDMVDAIGLAEINAGAFLIAKAEVLTLKGAFADAESAFTDADKFDQQHPRAAMTWSLTGAPLLAAKAFLLEKKGDLKGAVAAYEAILAAGKEKGWQGTSFVVNGRLAVIALLKGDDAAAKKWSENSLSSDPGANVVWGALLQKKGDSKASKEYYAAALTLMSNAADGTNWCLPIYFAEQQRAKAGLK